MVSAEGDDHLNCFSDSLSFVNDTVAQTNAYASIISDAANAGNNISSKWENLETELAKKLKNVARLISGGLQTRIYIVQIGGFDTHDNQVVDSETSNGIHSELLRELSDSICAFQDDLNLLKVNDRVIGMTYSEFGRRIRSNSALGTDHGTAAPMFIFGTCVENQILGDHPEIDTQVGIDEGVPMQYDFRDIYSTILQNWLGLNELGVKNVIHPDFNILPLIKSECIGISSVNQDINNDIEINFFPNPVFDNLNIEIKGLKDPTKLNIFDAKGSLINSFRIPNNQIQSYKINLNTYKYQSGSYFIHIDNQKINKTKKFIKI